MTPKKNTRLGLSIGAVARETGISIEALRMWERRYGSPESIRLPSGHRRYPLSEVNRLRTVARALDAGYRAGQVVGASLDELNELLRAVKNALPEGENQGEARKRFEEETVTARWLEATQQLDDEALTNQFYRDWGQLGPLRFVNERVIRFLRRLGDGWIAGEITVAEEHFASERLSDFLAGQWRRMNERLGGRPLLVASLPGDPHRLGLHMVSTVAAAAEQKVVYVGPQTPIRELISATRRVHPVALCLSISGVMDQRQSIRSVDELRVAIDEDVSMVVGGEGAPLPQPGVHRITEFTEFYDWARTRREREGQDR